MRELGISRKTGRSPRGVLVAVVVVIVVVGRSEK